MKESINKDLRKADLSYLDGIYDLQKRHMDLLTDLIQRPTLGKEITDITIKKQELLNNDLIHTEIDIPVKKDDKKSLETK